MMLAIVNAGLPGSGLIVRDHMISGLFLLILALLCLGVSLAAGLLATPAFAADLRLAAISGYGASALIAIILWLIWERAIVHDLEAVMPLSRTVTSALLCGQGREALSDAKRLCRLAADQPGAWLLLARCAQAAEQPGLAHRANKRAERLRCRDQ
ncbi:MAG: hypothetical protein ACYTF0_09265 [Planctomycetota bacterium]